MGALSPWHLALILLAVLLLSGYKKLPEASRSIGRSLRIFKGEMKGMKDDDARAADLSTKDAATATPVRGEVLPPAGRDDLESRLEQEARAAEARAAEPRAQAAAARVQQSRAVD